LAKLASPFWSFRTFRGRGSKLPQYKAQASLRTPNRSMKQFARATLVYVFVGLFILVVAPVAMLWTVASGNTTFIYRAAHFCIRTAGWLCGVRVKSEGREKIRPGQNYLFVSNHQGNFDGPVLFHTIPRDFRVLIKKEMMQIPVLSVILKQVRFVPINRSNPASAKTSINCGVELLKEGYSLVAFPEGTRSRDGRLGPFKKGAFLMALRAKTPILPISIANSREIQPPGTYGIHPGVIEVIFHDPIFTDELGIHDSDELAQRTRTAIASGLLNSRHS
jgi:1-acyl-sn-glycerol-3-phosphate acyltransferase